MSTKLADRSAAKPLGSHTALGHLHSLRRWKDIPFLRENRGMLPPFIIAVGSRTRVLSAPEVLGLRRYAFIDQKAGKVAGIAASGRVAMLVGAYVFNGQQVPLAVVETQMGCPATQITLKEMLYFARDDGYALGRNRLHCDWIYVIRAGTAAGVNSLRKSEANIAIGDITITTETYGVSGAILQSLVGELDFLGDVIEKVEAIRRAMLAHRILDLSHDARTFRTMCSHMLVLHLQLAADARGLKNYVGPGFSKDSLYGELGEEGFAALRDNYGVISTEMEQLVINALAGEFRRAGINVHSGLISAIVGAIPGRSFPQTRAEQMKADTAERNIMLVAADALGRIATEING